MELGMIGLGKMGGNMVRRLARGGHHVLVYDRLLELGQGLAQAEPNVVPATSLTDMANRLTPPRAVWIMVPAGNATEETFGQLLQVLAAGDTVIDGGNSNYKDSQRRAQAALAQRLDFLDVGTSGGIGGLANGYSLMVGGDKAAVEHLRPIFETLAPAADRGWGHVGPSGSGHFAKMVHNGIEYGLMQAYAEGLAILRAKEEFDLDVHQIAEIWRHGAVVRSWLLDITAEALAKDANLADIRPWVPDSGEGRWTVLEAIDQDVPAPVLTLSLMMRFVSRQDQSTGNYAARVLAAMRNQFGGHAVKRRDS
jgi:6-phosphogluconate dehydrogenase